MGKNRVILIALLILLLLASSCEKKGDNNSNESTAGVDAADRSAIPLGYASKAFDEIVKNLFTYASTGVATYPHDYAGYYYREKDEKLVILLTGLEDKQKYCDATSYPEVLDFEIEEYSLNVLYEYSRNARAAFEKRFQHVMIHPDEQNNVILILFLEEDFETGTTVDLKDLELEFLEGLVEFGYWSLY